MVTDKVDGRLDMPHQREGLLFQPVRVALVFALVYSILCGTYIWFSGFAAARMAQDVESLRYIESVKGTIFIIVTGIALFLLSWALLALLARQEVELLQQRDALVESERRASAGLFASSVAHDINNILMALRFDMDELEQADGIDENYRQTLQRVNKAQEDLAVLARRLVATGQKEIPGEFVEVEMVPLVRDTIDYVQLHSKARTCRIDLDAEGPVMIHANPTIIRQMLSNLLINAAEATNGRGHIMVRLRETDKDLVIEVHDNGPGIPSDRWDSIMTALHTSKLHGSGLGLLSVKVYAEAHQGRVRVDDSFLGGACFVITLPLHERASLGILAEVF